MDTLYDVQTVNGRSVYTAQSHHHVLKPWAMIRRQLPTSPNLISFDHHTDSQLPFFRYVYWETKNQVEDYDRDAKLRADEVASICFADDASIEQAIARLHHDEHIQAATLSYILNVAFVFSLDDASGTESVEEAANREGYPYWQRRYAENPDPSQSLSNTYKMPEGRIFHVPHEYDVGCKKDSHDNDCYYDLSCHVLESDYLSQRLSWAQKMANSIRIANIEEPPYILDIDLDFFHTTKALNPDDPSVFYRLIRNSQAVTVAVEAECTQSLWLDSEPPRTDDMLLTLYQHIGVAMRGV